LCPEAGILVLTIGLELTVPEGFEKTSCQISHPISMFRVLALRLLQSNIAGHLNSPIRHGLLHSLRLKCGIAFACRHAASEGEENAANGHCHNLWRNQSVSADAFEDIDVEEMGFDKAIASAKKELADHYSLRSAHLESNITEFPLAFRLGVQG
jgi:hypothetical protein